MFITSAMILIFFVVCVFLPCLCKCAHVCACGGPQLTSCVFLGHSPLHFLRQGLSVKPRAQKLSSQLPPSTGTVGSSHNSLDIYVDSRNQTPVLMFAWQVLCPQSSPRSREFQGIYKWQKFITPSSGGCSVHNQWTSTFCSWLRSGSLRWCPHHSSGSFPSDSCVKNWIHSCGWSLYDSVTFSKTQTPSSSFFLFIPW